ncbi:MAG: DUF4179 domain-containing protein [Lachnospiraceae bacterium]|jgi:hypothetical protein|nr:DUF4179 domain-containing protein [Lachnospiraceae bacterium]
MMLEHNTYKEAISDVKLPEEIGMDIVEGAIQRKERRTQKLRARAVAAIAGVFILAFGANGICYAQTGMNIWDLLDSVHHKTDSATAAAITENVQQSDDTILYKNLKFTLESYYFDPINCEAYYTIRTDSLDGSVLSTENIEGVSEYYFSSSPDRMAFETGGGSCAPSNSVYANETHTSIRTYYHDVYHFENDGRPEDTMKVNLEVKSGETVENGITYHEYAIADNFVLQPTGQIPCRYADGSSLDGCTNIKITTGGICFTFDKYFDLEENEPYPIGLVTFTMKDGTSYYMFDAPPEGWEMLEAADTLDGTGYRTPDGEVPKDSVLGTFAGGGGFDGYAKSGWKFEFFSTFNSLINIDDIASIHVDGVEMPLK